MILFPTTKPFIIHFVVFCYVVASTSSNSAIITVKNGEQEAVLELGDDYNLVFYCSGNLTQDVVLQTVLEGEENKVVLSYNGTNVTVTSDDCLENRVVVNETVGTVNQGKAVIRAAVESGSIDVSEAFITFAVQRDQAFETAGLVLGWISTICWDISFLPQIWHNFRRHSVVGLSFDFLTYNLIGFSCYFVFNAGMLWIDAIKDEFRQRHPYEVLHVRLNDVFFPLYAVLCTIVQLIQCFFYEKDIGQRVSTVCRIVSAILLVVVAVGCILAVTVDTILWIDALYLMSYVKLFISTIKYTPQLYTNYKAESTEGWSIGQVILDFTGGIMSLIQMFLVATNYDDYSSVFTDPTKLGLSLLSIGFNIFFFIQHFWLYRKANNSEEVKLYGKNVSDVLAF